MLVIPTLDYDVQEARIPTPSLLISSQFELKKKNLEKI